MSNRANRKSQEEQYQLIMECRSSGMSDQQWCLANDINPGTFYNWVKRLRQKGGYEIPDPANKNTFAPEPKQDVVRMEILPEIEEVPSSIVTQEPINPPNEVSGLPTIQIRIGQMQISLTNDVDPHLLSQILCQAGSF